MSWKNRLFTGLVFIFGAWLLLSVEGRAGITGKIVGTVTDLEGQPLPDINVVIVDRQLGAATDLDGFYQILNIPPGSYDLRFSGVGYKTVEVTRVLVNTDLTATVNARLEPTVLEAGETVVIKARREQIQVDRTFAASYVDAEKIRALPVKGYLDTILPGQLKHFPLSIHAC